MKKLAFLVVVFLLALSVFFIYKYQLKEEEKIITVQKRNIIKAVYASGIVKPENQIDIKSTVSGYIVKLFIEENQKVTENQLVAVIDHSTLDKQIKEIQVKIERIKQKLDPQSTFRKTLQNKINLETKNLEFLNSKLQRRLPLYKKKQISEEEIKFLENQIQILKKKIEILKGEYEEKINDLKNQLKVLLAKKEKLEVEKEKHFIKTPINGTILKTYVKKGDYINHMIGKNVIATVGDLSKMEIVLEVDQEYIYLIKKGQKVLISVDALPEKVFKGKVTKILKKSDPAKRVIKVKVSSTELPHLPAESSVEANIIIYEKEAVAIPVEAVKDGKVLVVKNKKTQEAKIKTGIQSEGYIEVIEGLKEGDKIVLP